MGKYRIKEYNYGGHKDYCIQRRFLWGFWYNPDNIDAYTTGFYDTLEEAELIIMMKSGKTTSRIVKYYDSSRE